MEFKDLINERRSVRQYDADKKVTREQLEEIIKQAQLAPTWKNSQNARYYCILGDKLDEIRENMVIGASYFP